MDSPIACRSLSALEISLAARLAHRFALGAEAITIEQQTTSVVAPGRNAT